MHRRPAPIYRLIVLPSAGAILCFWGGCSPAPRYTRSPEVAVDRTESVRSNRPPAGKNLPLEKAPGHSSREDLPALQNSEEGSRPLDQDNEAAAAPEGYTELGFASYYANEFKSRKTANGERFNPQMLTAAHRTLPFNAMAKVTNLATGRSVVVRINDRGPHAKNRIIDLSYAAAKAIDMIKAGTAKVRIEIIK